jgi:hypothetical protein
VIAEVLSIKPEIKRESETGFMPLQKDKQTPFCGLYRKNITIVNDTSRVSRMTLQVVASPTIIILKTLEVSLTLLENTYGTGMTHNDHHMAIKIFL